MAKPDGAAEAGASTEPGEGQGEMTAKKILLVDDEDGLRASLAEQLAIHDAGQTTRTRGDE